MSGTANSVSNGIVANGNLITVWAVQMSSDPYELDPLTHKAKLRPVLKLTVPANLIISVAETEDRKEGHCTLLAQFIGPQLVRADLDELRSTWMAALGGVDEYEVNPSAAGPGGLSLVQ